MNLKHEMVSTHSRPKAAVERLLINVYAYRVSTHSRPKAAAMYQADKAVREEFQHTAARRRLPYLAWALSVDYWFQHTAARRRLEHHARDRRRRRRFNTQPPEGG